MALAFDPLMSRAYWRFKEEINPHNAILPISEKIREKHYYMFDFRTNMNLYDPVGNHHRVLYDPKSNPPALTLGWTQLVQFYRIEQPIFIEFLYVGASSFVIKIKNEAGWEIAYKAMNEEGNHQVGQNQYVLEVTHTLTASEASRSHLDIPHDAAQFVRKHGKEPWKLVGPTGRTIECTILIPKMKDRAYVAKFGSGWKQFCLENQLKEDDHLYLKFTNPFVRKVSIGYA